MKHQKLITTKETSKRMGSVHLKGGTAEVLLAKRLWHLGYRYRLNYRKLPGSPDIAITKQKIAIFIDGEFWHGYDWESRKQKLKRNREYWIEKIEENMSRDTRVDRMLISKDWTPLHFWTKEVINETDNCISTIQESIFLKQIELID